MVEWKRTLGSLELTGPRRRVRQLMVLGVGGVTVVCMILFLLEAHSIYEEPSHSLLGESTASPLLCLAVVLVISVLARTRGLATGMLTGLAGVVAAVVCFGMLIFVHLLSHVVENTAGNLLIYALAALAVISLATMVVELVVRVLERRRLEATDPVFPTARVVA